MRFPPLVQVLVPVLLAVRVRWWGVAAQGQPQPFAGQGVPPPTGPTPVYASAYLDRLVQVQTTRYSFEAVIYLTFSWVDARANASVEAATQEAFLESQEERRECLRPCVGGVPQCCDTLWLPGSALRNVDELPDGRVAEEVIALDPSTGAVRWTHLLHGIFLTPMDFHAFPFESLQLLVEMSAVCDDCGGGGGWFYVVSGAGARVDREMAGGGHFNGDDLSGYAIQSASLHTTTWNTSSLLADSTGPDANDPFPLTAAKQFQGLVVVTHVRRISGWWLVNMLIPLYLIVALSWTVFLVTPYHLDTRLGTCVTLFLALTTLQIVYTSDLPQCSYLTLVDALVLLSYFAVAGAAIESLAVHQLVRTDKRFAHGKGAKGGASQPQERRGTSPVGHESPEHGMDEQRVHVGFASVNVADVPGDNTPEASSHPALEGAALAAVEARESPVEDSEWPTGTGLPPPSPSPGPGPSPAPSLTPTPTPNPSRGSTARNSSSRFRGWEKFSQRWRQAWTGAYLDDERQGGAERDSHLALTVSSRIDFVCLCAFPAVYTLAWLISLLAVGLTAD